MTTPDNPGSIQDIGIVELIGVPFSTFTRTIACGLYELRIPFIEHHTAPHSDVVYGRNPFGLIPVLVYRPDALYTPANQAIELFESNAIRRYLDEALAPLRRITDGVAPLTPLLREAPAGTPRLVSDAAIHAGGPTDGAPLHDVLQLRAAALRRAKVDQYISLASTVLFVAVERGVVKPRISMERNGAGDATIRVALIEGIEELHRVLSHIEDMANKDANAAAAATSDATATATGATTTPTASPSNGALFLAGSHTLTWADLYVYPPLADLRATPEGDVLRASSSQCKFPWLATWLDRMDSRNSVKRTYEGTLAHSRRIQS